MIAQVERIVERGSLPPQQVKMPRHPGRLRGVAEKPEYHQQTFAEPYSAAFAGEIRVPMGQMGQMAPMVMGERKLIARRAALTSPSAASSGWPPTGWS